MSYLSDVLERAQKIRMTRVHRVREILLQRLSQLAQKPVASFILIPLPGFGFLLRGIVFLHLACQVHGTSQTDVHQNPQATGLMVRPAQRNEVAKNGLAPIHTHQILDLGTFLASPDR